MRVIPPIPITDARLISSTAAEPGVSEAAYDAETEYGVGDQVILGSPSSTVTISIAEPGVVSWSAHGLPNGTPVVLTTTGDLPTGLSEDTTYYIVARATGTFQLSETVGGRPITTTGSQSGTHTATAEIHRRYESLAAANTGNSPAIDDGTKWLDIGPTNQRAMFDTLRNTRTWAESPLVVVLEPGERFDAFAALGLVADTITFEVDYGDDTYSFSEDLLTRDVFDLYDYFFAPVEQKAYSAQIDIPPFTGAKATVTLTRAAGPVGVGALVIGQSIYLGYTQYGAESDAINFSSVERDFEGNASFVRRRSIPKTNQTVVCPKGLIKKLLRARDDLNAVPAVWTGIDDADHDYYEPLLILGFYRRWTINAAHPEDAVSQIELEEV